VEDEMNARKRSYTVYGIGVGIVWAVILVVVSLFSPAGKRHTVFTVFGGFVIGWVSATIARYVYPPPKKYRQDTGRADPRMCQ
jgi:tetrahydromethanopterin S-methyltransferase subunit F